jgi:hypothetical protein
MNFKLKSPAFADDAPIPRRFTGEGSNVSPRLEWSEPPTGTQELALVVDDPDAPTETPFVHWVLYKIKPDARSLTEGAGKKADASELPGAMQGRNSFGKNGYGGPMPPSGHGPHHYRFNLYALDRPLAVGPNSTKDELMRAMSDHVLAQATLTGVYERL